MLIRRLSPVTGNVNVMELDITEAQLRELQSPNRRVIQEIVPQLAAEEREFLISGYTPEDWAKIFPPEDNDE